MRTYSVPRPYYILLAFNIRHPILRNVEVRRAINEALDRDALVRDGLRGQGTPCRWADPAAALDLFPSRHILSLMIP